MYLFLPENLIIVPLMLWVVGSAVLVRGARSASARSCSLAAVAAVAIGAHFLLPGILDIPKLAVSDYKGVAYARKFPDAKRVYESVSPFGDLEVYSSSYLHFAPGLSDNAAFNLPKMPANAYLGMYIDGDGPIGIIRDLPPEETAYFHYLPMIYPYLIKQAPKTFVVQFGGGISTTVALRSNPNSVTVAEANPAVLARVPHRPGPARLHRRHPQQAEGPRHRLRRPALSRQHQRALRRHRPEPRRLRRACRIPAASPSSRSSPTRARRCCSYMRALKDGGILSVTLWNKEEPPKSVLKLYATMAEAARELDARRAWRTASSSRRAICRPRPCSTSAAASRPTRSTKLRAHTARCRSTRSTTPGFEYDDSQTAAMLEDYRNQIFGDGSETEPKDPKDGRRRCPATREPGPDEQGGNLVPATTLGQLAWHRLINGGWEDIAKRVRLRHPAAHQQPALFRRLREAGRPCARHRPARAVPGRVGLSAALGDARDRLRHRRCRWCCCRLIFGWRTIFSHNPGKFRTIVYFACLGVGYIMVEVGLIAEFILALSQRRPSRPRS